MGRPRIVVRRLATSGSTSTQKGVPLPPIFGATLRGCLGGPATPRHGHDEPQRRRVREHDSECGYNEHSDRGGGCATHPTLREARVVAQVWEWCLLQFHLPLQTQGVQHRMSSVVSTLMEPVGQPPRRTPMPRSPSALAFFQRRRKLHRGNDHQERRKITSENDMPLLALVCIL